MCLDHIEKTIVNGSNMLVENYLTESDKDLHTRRYCGGNDNKLRATTGNMQNRRFLVLASE
jgi:hypothetical protein